MGTIMGNGVTIRGGSRAGAKIATTLNEDGTQNIYINDNTKMGKIDTTIAIKALFYNGVSVPLSSSSIPSSDIPLSGELVVGNLVTYDDKTWRVVHNEGTKWYLASKDIIEDIQFGTSNIYAKSSILARCAVYLSNLSDVAQKYITNITVNNVTFKVFVPSYEQVNGGFSYYNSKENRICNYNGNKYTWWTSSLYDNSSNHPVYGVTTGGIFSVSSPSSAYGFRPHICIDTSLSGSDVKIDAKILAGTYTFKNTLTSVSNDITGAFVYSTNSINMIKMIFTTGNILQYWKDTSNYTPVYDNTSWRDSIFKTVIIPYDTTVDTDFYTWFTSNTTKTS